MLPFKTVDRSREYWLPDKRWLGDTVFVLGGGPSLADSSIDFKHIHKFGWLVAINSLFRTVPFSDAVFFTDYSWFTGDWQDGTPRRRTLEKSQALLLTTSRQVKRLAPDRIKLIRVSGTGALKQGRSSGHTAISVVMSMGAKRVVLLGYDMRFVEGRSHSHDEYACKNVKLYAKDFVPAFNGWNAWAKKTGVEILNATPGSALNEFKKIKLEEVLR